MNFEDKSLALLVELTESVNRMANVMEENAFKEDPIEKIKLARAEAMVATFKDRLIEQGDEPFVTWAENQVNISFDDLIEVNESLGNV